MISLNRLSAWLFFLALFHLGFLLGCSPSPSDHDVPPLGVHSLRSSELYKQKAYKGENRQYYITRARSAVSDKMQQRLLIDAVMDYSSPHENWIMVGGWLSDGQIVEVHFINNVMSDIQVDDKSVYP